jgi:hypothetical protein
MIEYKDRYAEFWEIEKKPILLSVDWFMVLMETFEFTSF